MSPKSLFNSNERKRALMLMRILNAAFAFENNIGSVKVAIKVHPK